MAGKSRGGNPAPVSDLAAGILDPVLRRRAGISLGLVQSWEEIAGPRLAGRTRPERIVWPRRASEDDPFQPATLIIACEGAAALHVQHETGEIIARVNGFLGFAAIGRVKIVQKPVSGAGRPRPKGPRPLTAAEEARLGTTLNGVENDDLRAALERLGRNVLASRRR